MKASTSIRGCPAVPSALTTTLCAPWLPVTTSAISAVLGELALVLMVCAAPESSLTVAEPLVGPCDDIQATWKPVKLNVAVFPATVAKSLLGGHVRRPQPEGEPDGRRGTVGAEVAGRSVADGQRRLRGGHRAMPGRDSGRRGQRERGT